MCGSRINHGSLRKFLQGCLCVSDCFLERLPSCHAFWSFNFCKNLIAFCFQFLQLRSDLGIAPLGPFAINQVGFLPPWRSFDGIESCYGCLSCEIHTRKTSQLNFCQCEDVVIFSFGQFRSRDANSTNDINLTTQFNRAQPRIGEVHLSVVRNRLPLLLISRILIGSHFDFETNGKSETGSNPRILIMAGVQHNLRNLSGLRDCDFNPLGRIGSRDD